MLQKTVLNLYQLVKLDQLVKQLWSDMMYLGSQLQLATIWKMNTTNCDLHLVLLFAEPCVFPLITMDSN